MLNRAPNVYVPVEPEDNGIAIPAVLSLIVHVAILLFIVFSHRIPDLDKPEPIETTLITPEELAAFQSNIAANREAMAAQKNAQPVPIDPATTSETINSSQQNSSEDITARPVPTQPREISRPPTISSANNSAISPVEDSTTEPTPIEASNPFAEEIANNDPIDDNADDKSKADSKSTNQTPSDKTQSDFGAADNPYGQQPEANSADTEALKKQIKGNIKRSIVQGLKPPAKNSKNTVYSATATIYLGSSGELQSISIEPNNSSTPQAYIDSVKKAINSSHAKTSLFKEAASIGLNPVILNFKS